MQLHGNAFIVMNDLIYRLMVNHLNLTMTRALVLLFINSIKNGAITLAIKIRVKMKNPSGKLRRRISMRDGKFKELIMLS